MQVLTLTRLLVTLVRTLAFVGVGSGTTGLAIVQFVDQTLNAGIQDGLKECLGLFAGGVHPVFFLAMRDSPEQLHAVFVQPAGWKTNRDPVQRNHFSRFPYLDSS